MILKFFQKLDDSIAYLFNNAINEKKFLKSYFKKKKLFLLILELMLEVILI